MTDINRELAEDAAEEAYPYNYSAQDEFAGGWMLFCDGVELNERWDDTVKEGYIAARDASA